MILHKNKQKAFTIVELLIVIVVIGILAAISIVAYNGIQNRARDTTVKDAASQVRSKIETYNSITGTYPTEAQWGTAGTDSVALNVTDDVTEAHVTGDINKLVKFDGTPDDHGGNHQIVADLCTGGADIVYYQSGSGDNPTITVGDGC